MQNRLRFFNRTSTYLPHILLYSKCFIIQTIFQMINYRKVVSLKKVNSKYILKSTLTPRLARKELQKELQSSPQLTKSRSCSSLQQETSSDPAGPGYNNYLTVHVSHFWYSLSFLRFFLCYHFGV